MLKFYTQVFADAGTRYFRMAEVLQRSAKVHGVDVTINTIKDTDEELEGKLHGSYYQNCRKTKHHANLIASHADGDVVVLLDADMLVLRPLAVELLEALGDKDIAITYRPASHPFMLNSGFIATRVSGLTKQLHQAWSQRAAEMVQEPRLYHRFRHRYGGVNQSALGSLLEEAEWEHVDIAGLSTLEWNAVMLEHHAAVERSRVVHLLGSLRKYCLGNSCPLSHQLYPLVQIWNSYADSFDNVAELRGLPG